MLGSGDVCIVIEGFYSALLFLLEDVYNPFLYLLMT